MKTLAHYRADLRIDLKDSGALWSDTELDRCIEKAVGDYSRFSPRQLRTELYFDFAVDDESFKTPQATDTDYFVTTWNIAAVTDGTSASAIANATPDVPRPVTITVTDANTSISQLVVIVKGNDKDGRYQEEFLYLSGGLIQTGYRYFAQVTGVEIERIQGNGTGDTMIVGTGSHLGVFVKLANKPIKFQSETITNYTRETDYTVDYAGGRIALITGTTMVVNTAYTIDYDKSKISVDLSSLLDNLIRVERVEYPAGTLPQSLHRFELWGNILTLAGGYESQEEASDDEHLVIDYLTTHTAPTLSASGSYPSFLDFTVQLAASAYALFIEALQYEHQAVTDFGAARDLLAAIVANAVTLIHKDIDDALDKVTVYLTNNSSEDSKFWLTKITTDIASLRTAAKDALDAANTYLDTVATTDLDKTVTGAEVLLDTGDDYIDARNVGVRVAENFREYSQARVDIANARLSAALGYVQEASARLSNIRTYIEQAAGWGNIAAGFLQEAENRIAFLDRQLAEAVQYYNLAQSDITLANAFKAEGVERRNEAWAIWSSPNQVASQYSLGQRGQPSTT